MLEGHHDLSLVVWLRPSEHCHRLHESFLYISQILNWSRKDLIEQSTSDTKLTIIENSLLCDFLHELFTICGRVYNIDIRFFISSLQLNNKTFLLQTILESVTITDTIAQCFRVYGDMIWGSDISRIILLVLEIKSFLCILAIHEVADDHTLVLIRNIAFIADIGSSQCIISSDHHTPDLSSLQCSNRTPRLHLQLVLEHFESIKN